MPEAELVRARAARILTDFADYHDLAQAPATLAERAPGVTLRADEAALGVYQNTPGRGDDAIVVTTRGLHVRVASQWEIIDYDTIQQLRGPRSKEEVSGVFVQLADGRDLMIPVRGAHDPFRDALGFLRFLRPLTTP
jgi:hypothetical protein